MDPATLAVYERSARLWQQRRGEANDDLGVAFRAAVGDGLIADLGCGTGRYLLSLGPRVVGVDASMAMLSLAASAARVRGDLEALPFAAGTFDGVFARNSYLHVPKARLGAALTDARRVLRPGGHILAVFIDGTYEGFALPGDDFPGRFFACWTARELIGLFSIAGFEEIEAFHVPRGQGADVRVSARAGRSPIVVSR